MSWVLLGEDTEKAQQLRSQAVDNPQLILLVPPTFWYEVSNVLWAANRRKRLRKEAAVKALESLLEFGFTTWTADPGSCLYLSFNHNLAVYDSAYLEIAIDQDAVLWTMDQAMRKIAEKLNIEVQPG